MSDDKDMTLKVNVNPIKDTVWLTLDDITQLFERNKSTISRHNNIFKDGELEYDGSVAFFATELIDKLDPRTGKITRSLLSISYYNLDMIIVVGYRVKNLKKHLRKLKY